MIDLVYSEFLKLKKSYIFYCILFGAVAVPIAVYISSFSMEGKNVVQSDIYGSMINMGIMQIQILYTILFSLITSYVFSREFSDKTANILYSYRSGRIKIFFAKFITIYILVLITYLINFASIIIMMYGIFGFEGVKIIFFIQLKSSIWSALMQIFIIPVPMFLGSVSKNIIIPIIYSLIGAVSSMMIMISGIYMQFSFFMLPALPLYYFYNGDPIDYIAVFFVAGITFIISIFLNIYYWGKIDIA